MKPLFSEYHATASSQLEGTPHPLRESAETYSGWMALAERYSYKLQYLDAIEAFSNAIALSPRSLDAFRQRGERYLATLQTNKAMADLERCIMLSGEDAEVSYLMGLCWYYAGIYGMAIREFSHTWDICDDELGIKAMYWSTLAAWKSGREPTLLRHYHGNMDVGQNTAYALAVQTAVGKLPFDEALWALDCERDHWEFSIMAYGVAAYCEKIGERETAEAIYKELLSRDSCWISHSYLAAWNDRRNGRI